MTTMDVRRYEFTETGVGCSRHGIASCLCDVDLHKVGVQPIRYSPTDVGFAYMATRLAGTLPDSRETFVDWAAWLLTVNDVAKRMKVDALVDVVAAHRFAADKGEPVHGTASRAACRLLAAGYGSDKIAEILSLSPDELLTHYALPKSNMLFSTYLRMEILLRDLSLSYADIGRECDCNYMLVRRHAERMGLLRDVRTYQGTIFEKNADVKAAFDKAQTEGLGYRKTVALIAELTGVEISTSTVKREIWRRRDA
jgi:hypothetical protein